MLLGYVVFSHDNKHSMYRNLKLNECDKYSDTYTINRIDPGIKIRTKKPISSTYDNFTIVSDQFKTFCEDQKYEGLEFVILPNSPGLYWFKIHNIIEYDIENCNVRLINYSDKCRGYEEIIGATPACLKIKELIPDGFFRTDICFGSFQSKSPLKVIGLETRQKLKMAGIKGLDLSEILDKYDWQT
ncbi:MAG: hypothetical protein JWR12_447 [Mucilaginibacter sp.]|nr:hypothetical protein [Mucilaginibacter sp.]